jgi:hypothetical protein
LFKLLYKKFEFVFASSKSWVDCDLIQMGNTCDMFDWEEDIARDTSVEERKNVVNCATCKAMAEIVNELEVKRNTKM